MTPAPRPGRGPGVLLLRAGARLAIAVSLIAAAATGAVLTLFTQPVFALLDFHPVALDYLSGRLSRDQIEALAFGGLGFSRSEIDHLDDVAALLARLGRVFALGVAVIAVLAVIDRSLLRPAASLAVVGLALAGAVVVAAYLALGFQTVGIAFHEVMFPRGNWSFPHGSLIIRLYGTGVMVKGAAFVIALGLGLLAAAFIATGFIARRTPRSQAEG